MLAERYVTEELRDFLLSRENYKPFPTIAERNEWGKLPANLKKFWIDKGESKLNYSWPAITATQYMDYSRTGNRVRYDTVSLERRQDLASLIVAECIENQGRFMDDIINGIWCICEETFWGIPGHGYMMKRQDQLPDVSDQIIELFSAETASLLAWAYYLLKIKLDAISIMVCERIQLEVKKRVLDPYLYRTDFWWMGFNQERMLNNWNPWCNSNCLSAFLLLEDDPQRREAAVVKAIRSLDSYIQRLHSDGGCEEGPKYWIFAGGTLFDCLELLYGVSGGKIDVYQEPLIQQIGRYIYKAFIDDSFYANFADSSAKVHIPAELTYRYGRRIEDARLSGLGAMVLKKKREEATNVEFPAMFRLLPALFNYTEILHYTGESPYIRDAWLDGIQVMVAREQEGSSKGLYLAAKGGHNDESHNHNDIGQFIVYCDGSPMIIDPGVVTYTSKSFFSERYTIWAMQSAYHNLPIVNGVQQLDGRQYKAYDVNYHQEDTIASLSMDIAGAYPDSAEIKSWMRSISLIRDSHSCIEIKDNFQLQRATDDISLILMTPYSPQIESTGSIVLQDENHNKVIIQYNGELFAVSTDKISLEDEVMRDIWGDQLYRIKLRTITAIDQAECIIKISNLTHARGG
ncbi:Heparinase II/III-like protein [Paenibacillus sp. yr247]|uniref:heparinase II/III domain-containing protein n=1 Tax=Paenibacillus sp. yr247 TaxID=1761880 RepID=UPI00088B892F|nr:heparinase II/III family protein [Paenibacillus sp. yr247]SDO42496.1 Heparinase II/III-like protein [Paenibacillus sp. yr247]